MAAAQPIGLSPAPADELLPGAYVTDGEDLFAILQVAHAPRSEPLVTYENCRTLALLVTPLGDLRKRGLELVRPAPATAARTGS